MKVLVAPPDAAVARTLRRSGHDVLEEARASRTPRSAAPDVVIIMGDRTIAFEIKATRAGSPPRGLVASPEHVTSAVVERAYSAGALVVALRLALKTVVKTVNYLEAVRARGRAPTHPDRVRPLAANVIAEFHDPRSGRLDAQRIADVLEVPLAVLARGLRLTRAALSRRPTAAAAQPGLRRLESGWGGTPTRARQRQGHPRLAPHGAARARRARPDRPAP